MGEQTNTTAQTFPSLEAWKRAKGKLPAAPAGVDPNARFYRSFGLWATGAVKDGPKPLPVLVEIKEEFHARGLVAKGGRPLVDADPELQAMLRDFYAGAKDVPPGLAEFLTAPVAAPAKAAK